MIGQRAPRACSHWSSQLSVRLLLLLLLRGHFSPASESCRVTFGTCVQRDNNGWPTSSASGLYKNIAAEEQCGGEAGSPGHGDGER